MIMMYCISIYSMLLVCKSLIINNLRTREEGRGKIAEWSGMV